MPWYFATIRKLMSACILILNSCEAKNENTSLYYFVKDRVVEIDMELAKLGDRG